MDDWLSTGDVAEILGVSRQHVVDLCDRGDLPCTRFGSHRRIRKSDLTELASPRLTHAQEKSLWLHQAVLGALMANPDEVLKTAKDNITRWKKAHRPDGMSVRYLEQWERAIDRGVHDVVRIMVGTDERSSELRQNSPFAGVLSERQRTRVLQSFKQHWHRTHELERAG